MSNTTYFTPANIFLHRDASKITMPNVGEISIMVQGGAGWMAYVSETRETLTSGNSVWDMCSWLNSKNCNAEVLR